MELRIYTRMLKTGWWIIVLTTLAALNLSLVASYVATPTYRATTRLLVAPNAALIRADTDRVDSLAVLDRPNILATYAQVLLSDRILLQAAASLNLDIRLPQKDYAIAAVVLPDANVLQLTVEGSNPATVTDLANRMAGHAIDYINALYEVYTLSVIDPAIVPTEPVSPQPVRDAGVAAVLGLVVGAVLAIVRGQLSTTLSALAERRRLDSESQAYERRHFEQLLDRRAAERTAAMALGLIQFDGLEALQETLPRSTLQTLLRHITAVLKNELRGNDVIARWDETQFAVLLPATTGSAAGRVLDRIQGVLRQPVALEDDENVTLEPRVGVGVRQTGESAPRLVERAEEALAQARRDRSPTVVVLP